jgi:hypothetical protein
MAHSEEEEKRKTDEYRKALGAWFEHAARCSTRKQLAALMRTKADMIEKEIRLETGVDLSEHLTRWVHPIF